MEPVFSHFNSIQNGLLLSAFSFFILSLVFQIQGKEKFSLPFLIITGLCVYSFAASLDPYLNIWDERFHALVAKNMMNHPYKPTLYDDPVINMAYDRWDRYSVWLHKQPLFLWQIALSFKIFGVSEFTLRIPNIVLGTVLIFAIYRTGKLLVNKNVGYLSGLFLMSTYYIFDLISGRQAVDHNDFTFLAYISLSLWAFVEYYYSGKKRWILLIGLFAGMAILCKWLVGLLVYLGWFVLKIQQKKYRISEYKDLLLSLAITCVLAAPWQVYTFIAFPSEATQAYRFNMLHVSKALDGHSGTVWYYFENFATNYGQLASFFVIPGFIVFYKNIRDKKLYFSLLAMVLAVYLFFTLAATKMLSFPTVVSMIILIALACLFDFLITLFKKITKGKSILGVAVTVTFVLLIFLRFDINIFREEHMVKDVENSYSQMLIHNKEVFKSLELPKKAVLFNVKGRHYVEAMFYTGIPAYNFVPSKGQFLAAKEKGRTFAIFKPADMELPEYLKNDSTIIFIDNKLAGYD
jgi:4-amino-4-deoxy-L-arabinose transferase-like glycosyltransferase